MRVSSATKPRLNWSTLDWRVTIFFMRDVNQYQANHDTSAKLSGSSGFFGLIRVVILLSILLASLWLWSWIGQ
jgi:hypothetical protein